MDRLGLSGRVAIVSGSSRGIGLAIAKRLAEHGAAVVLNGLRDEGSLRDRADEISKAYAVRVIPVIADVSTDAGAQSLVRSAYSEFRRLDIMVNNAGVLRDSLIGMIGSDDIDETLRINLRSVITGTQAASRLMLRNKSGSIVNIASIIGRFGNKGQLVYGASKAGVIGATYSAAKELAPSGIRVNAIAPGFIDTDMVRSINEDVFAERIRSIAMGRIGSPEDIADAALFFASDLSRYVTGQVLGVDGGMLI
ncbi:MAG: glucose 1-dehydrogenase [Gammaproteobacteria bacterium]|nr:glucose 1-dehydrogenase [Gammaproteobacteria bacterium]